MSYLQPLRRLCLTAALVALGAQAVTLPGDPEPHMWHSFNTPDVGFLGLAAHSWSNTDAGALYAEWGGFVPTAQGSWVFIAPNKGQNGRSAVELRETSRTGLLTGTGNIYGLAGGQMPGAPLVFELTLRDTGASAPAGQVRTVVMRTGTKGTLPRMTATLNGLSATAIVTFRLDGTIEMPTGPGGALETNTASDAEWFYRWDDVPADAASLRFDFAAQVGHMSLDNLAVYASPTRAQAAPLPNGAVSASALAGLAEADIEAMTVYTAGLTIERAPACGQAPRAPALAGPTPCLS